MNSSVRNKGVIAWVAVLVFLFVTIYVWAYVVTAPSSGVLTVTFFDVGQGDALLIETPNNTRVLIDGGKGRAVLSGLGIHLPFSARVIDMVIATHPDFDHIGGLPGVFERYTVLSHVSSGVMDTGADNVALSHAVQTEGLQDIVVQEEKVFVLDEGVYLEILFPDRDVRDIEVNTGSIVARLTYGDTSFLFMGDAPTGIESYLVEQYGESLKSTVLKLGHHGSNTSSSVVFLGYVQPEYSVVSAGCDNPYGHPHTDVLERLNDFGVSVLETCTHGDIVFVSDGVTVSVL